ncbi:2,3-bisphosphoglycerate-independent phosphoglycerate mutase [Candidatus Woesearchaeota archaeon]|nr:2,3-bisphosphoglycerate-independent phosphoglycerate mutase [Candidatus Woesearchaeota archaeon]
MTLLPKHKVMLLVNDGWGIAPPGPGNYVCQSKTPFFDTLLKYPHGKNKAWGNAVGLPDDAQGNSEVGHVHLGAGRVVWQMFELINRAVKEGNFYKNAVLSNAMEQASATKKALHLIGLCSDGGIHSHLNHLFAALELAKKHKVKSVYIHFFADGRDVPEKSAGKYIGEIEQKCKELGLGTIASMVGRYYAMDRDKNWDRTQKAYELLTQGKGFAAKTPGDAVKQAYKRGDKTDYYIQPTVVAGFQPIKNNDVVLFFNFRTDRPRQLNAAFTQKMFAGFKRKKNPKTAFFTLTEYDPTFTCPFAFHEPVVNLNLGKIIAEQGLKQMRIAETDKYPHVTYFFNSQQEVPYPGEARAMVPSPKVPSYDLQPEMNAHGITREAVKAIKTGKYSFILINFANCDLVGHSSNKKAIIRAVETVDACNKTVVETALNQGYVVCITSDHGNAEEKLYPDGSPRPSHSCNPVPFFLLSKDKSLQKVKLSDGELKDVAPTILALMGIPKPKEMTGKSLVISVPIDCDLVLVNPKIY